MSSGPPTISVARSVHHLTESFGFRPGAMETIGDYYDALPHERPLEDCHIHFSGLAIKYGDRGVNFGVHLPDRSLVEELDITAPPADIVIFLGSFLLMKTPLSYALGHELAHFAQGGHRGKNEELRALQSQLRSRLSLRGQVKSLLESTRIGIRAAFAETAQEEHASLALASGFLAGYLHRLTEADEHRKLENKAAVVYATSDREQQANHHTKSMSGVFAVGATRPNRGLVHQVTLNRYHSHLRHMPAQLNHYMRCEMPYRPPAS